MSLDRCIIIPPVTGPGCVLPTGTANCNTTQIPIDICPPVIDDPGDPKCVNDNARRPWPTPPPAEIGCNPVSLQVTNEPPAEEDPNQTIRLEGSVTYISGDACLPQVNLNLVVPPSIAAGGGSPSISGFGYTQYGACLRVGPVSNDAYDNPQDFFGNEPGAATFAPRQIAEMNQLGPCEEDCVRRARFGSQVAKFNLIGPLLAEITGSTPAHYVSVRGTTIATGWKYTWEPSVCVTAANECMPLCPEGSWVYYQNNNLQRTNAWNNKENVYGGTFSGGGGYMTPGISLEKQFDKGFKPVPIMAGTQVLMYAYVPWGPDNCECDIVWFFSEQVAFDGDCEDAPAPPQFADSILPQRNVTSAGMFFGSPDNANRV